MKKPVMQRSMFVAMTPKSESKGIISGFDEEMENEDYEDRTPENLEIIANNLRGDIRSMDERYMELAQLVGEAAFDTPEEVVALIQAQMGQGQQAPMTPPPTSGGIAGLGAAPAVPQQQAGIVPEQPPAEEQPPVQMAQGGVVYRQAGSPPWGEIKAVLDQFQSFPSAPPLGDYPEGARRLGFMKYLPQGTLASSGQVPPSSYVIPRAVLQQTVPMTGLLTGEAAQFLQSGAGSPGGALPQQIPAALRASTAISEGMRNIVPFTREASRALMSTPYGRGAAVLSGGALAALPFLGGGKEPSGGPEFSEVPGVDAQGRYRPVLRSVENMPGTAEEKAAVRQMGLTNIQGLGMADIGAGPTPEQVLNVTAPTEEPAAAAGPTTVPGPTRVAPAQVAPKSRTFKERVQDRIDIYKDVLGDDENMRQAQALFLLAESALNVAGAKGRSVGERLTTGLKGLPSAMGALGAEKAKRDLAVRTAAVSAVEQEMAAEAKSGTQLAIRLMDLNARNADINAVTQYLVETQGFSPEKANQVARLNKAGAIKTNEAGEMVDLTGRIISSPFRLSEGDVGFLPADGSIPFVSVGKRTLVPATPKDRPALATELGNNQSMAAAIERVMQLPSFESMVGPIAKIQSGVTSVLTPFFGANIPFTDLAKDVQKNIARELRNELITLNARNTSRPSVWEQKQVEKFIADPDAILTSPEEFFGILNNFRVKAINRANEIEHQLTGQPLKQLEYIPMGTSKDPLQAKDTAYLNEFFRLRPNGSIFIQLPNERAPRKFTAQEWFSQTRTQ
jgi:hypothetical protein